MDPQRDEESTVNQTPDLTTSNAEGDTIVRDEKDFDARSCTTSPLVTIVFGDRKQEYTIHKSRLIEKSPFFKACLENQMIESVNNRITLPEDQCRAFDTVASWVYTGSVEKITKSDESLLSAVKSYQLADKYMMPHLQQAIIQDIKNDLKGFSARPRDVIWAVESLQDGSALRRLLVDQFIWELVNNPCHYQLPSDKTVAIQNSEELEDLLTTDPKLTVKIWWDVQNLKRDRATEPASLKGCHYHVHPEGDECDN